MPLPHFLMLIAGVVVLAVLTLWASLSAGTPLIALLLLALTAAGLVHISRGIHHDHDG